MLGEQLGQKIHRRALAGHVIQPDKEGNKTNYVTNRGRKQDKRKRVVEGGSFLQDKQYTQALKLKCPYSSKEE